MISVKIINANSVEVDRPLTWKNLESQGLERRDRFVIDECGLKISFLVGRETFILIKLDYLRGMIFEDYLYLFISSNPSTSEKINQFVIELKLSIKINQNKRFVLIVLEEFFQHVHNNFINQMSHMRPEFKKINESLLDNKRIFKVQRDHLRLHFKTKDIYELLHELSIGKDEKTINELVIVKGDDAALVKSQLFDLIDSYASYYEEMVEELDQFDELISLTIKLVNIRMSETRNNLAKIGIYLNISAIAIALANFVTSSFGMNVNNHLNYRHSFLIINLMMLAIIVGVTLMGSLIFYKYG